MWYNIRKNYVLALGRSHCRNNVPPAAKAAPCLLQVRAIFIIIHKSKALVLRRIALHSWRNNKV